MRRAMTAWKLLDPVIDGRDRSGAACLDRASVHLLL
jgi:hypothetical protein